MRRYSVIFGIHCQVFSQEIIKFICRTGKQLNLSSLNLRIEKSIRFHIN